MVTPCVNYNTKASLHIAEFKDLVMKRLGPEFGQICKNQINIDDDAASLSKKHGPFSRKNTVDMATCSGYGGCWLSYIFGDIPSIYRETY